MLRQTDATSLTPGLEAFRAELGGGALRLVERRPLPDAVGGRCYWDVRDRVVANGGSTLFGWMVIEVPALALMGWHHAIWLAPDGEALDISPHPLTAAAPGVTAFIDDVNQRHDCSWPLGIRQSFRPLVDDVRLSAFVSAYDDEFALRHEHMRAQRSVSGTIYDPVTASVRASDASAMARLRELSGRYDPIVRTAEERRMRLLAPLIAAQKERLGPE